MQTLINTTAISYSTFRFDVRLSSVTDFSSVAELEQHNLADCPVILGEGSNTIFMQSVDRPVYRFVADNKQAYELDNEFVLLHVDAGHNWHQLVNWCVEQQYWGLENLALIPGTVGAAPVQNIGAYGVELADRCSYVDFFHWETKKLERIAAGRCFFGYRDSVFKHALAGKGIIVAVGLMLSKRASPVLSYKGLDHLAADVDIESIFQQVIAIRSSKLPDPAQLANCGSFFKNPIISSEHYQRLQQQDADIPGFKQADGKIKVPAAWLIDRQGFKGQGIGDIKCYHQQPLVIVNEGHGTPVQLEQHVRAIQQKVSAVYGIALEPEVRMLNADGKA